MVNGLYTASRGMTNIMAKQDINSQNLANTNTSGFKLARMSNTTEVTVSRNDQGQLTQREFQNVTDCVTSFSQGPMVRTGNDFDLALNGKGFFTIETPYGPRYTRNGGFTLNAFGELVTLSGKRLLDNAGAPVSMKGEKSQFMEDGTIFVDGKKSAVLDIVDFEDTKKLRYGEDGLFYNSDMEGNPPRAPEEIGVRQGFLEGSNVDPISTMVSLMVEFRNYEADQKALKAIDDTIGKAVNEVGRV
jgi:flagellar basal-body rod protein FlgF